MSVAVDFVSVILVLLFAMLSTSFIVSIPVIGPPIQQWLTKQRPKFEALKTTFLFPIYVLSRWFSQGARIFERLTYYVPDKIQAWIKDERESIGHDYRHLIDYTQTWAKTQFASLTAKMNQMTGNIVSWAQTQFSRMVQDYRHLGDYIETWAKSQFDSITAGYKHLGDYIETWAKAQFDALGLSITGAYNQIEHVINPRVKQLEQTVSAQEDLINTGLRRLENELNASNADQIAKIAAVSVAVEGVTVALSDLQKNCTNNLCFNLGDLADTVSALDQGVTLAALLALVAGAATDTKGTAGVVTNIFGPQVKEVSEFVGIIGRGGI
jgi:hypothetical protein